MCGHDVGSYAFVAAGAVVAADVPDHALVIGVPGRVMGYVCTCGVRLGLAPGDAAGLAAAIRGYLDDPAAARRQGARARALTEGELHRDRALNGYVAAIEALAR